ncbi:hypothetical protein C8039_18530 [Halogeometricum sp. wsp3]|nr:hypothetical protein C8039_18530 [Halogeometricum sp. wsp3]
MICLRRLSDGSIHKARTSVHRATRVVSPTNVGTRNLDGDGSRPVLNDRADRLKITLDIGAAPSMLASWN